MAIDHACQKVYDYIDAHFAEHVANFQELIRQKSVSPLNLGMAECAALVERRFRAAGCEKTEIIPTAIHPIVWGEIWNDAPATMLVYFMYDTQPVEDEAWTSPPFAAEIVRRPGLGRCLIGRGAINSKGPMSAFLDAVASIRAVHGRLPVNLLLLAEGEEEMGSRSLQAFVRDNADRLKRADCLFMPLSDEDDCGTAKVTLGVKGIVYFELECSGASWGRGPQAFDIHGSSKAIVDSPAWRLVRALATMTSEDGNRALVEGFYDEVQPPDARDRALLDELQLTFDPTKMMIEIGDVKEFIGGTADRRALLERYLFQPTLNIDGIWGGYIHAGGKTVLPHKVTVKMDVRLVPDMDVDETAGRVRSHLDRHGFPDIKMNRMHGYEWAKTSPDSDIARAHIDAMKSFGHPVEVWPIAPGTGPWYLFCKMPLNLSCVIGGLGHGARAHAPDEYFVIEGEGGVSGFGDCEKSYVRTIFEYAAVRARGGRAAAGR